MSRMSEFYIEVTELVESGVSYDSIIDKMVAEGFPRAACRTVIDQIVEQTAPEAYYYGA